MHFLKILLLFIFIATELKAQTLGGNAVYNFLTQPGGAQIAALGGTNISHQSNDVSLGLSNPALLRSTMHHQVATSFNGFLAGINNYSAVTAFSQSSLNWGAGVQFLDYGSITQTDASGTVFGSIRPRDFAIHLMASKQYRERFYIGTTLKFIQSNYGPFQSSGIAVDVGLTYQDTANQWQAAFQVKNMGTQISTYGGGMKEELPFDVQAGISKRLANAPIQFSLTAHNLHRLRILYNDTTFNSSEGDLRIAGILQKTFAHLILSAQIYIGDKVEATLGYNFLRRQDLNVFNSASGLNGLTAGAGFLHKKLHVRYATGFYQQRVFHQFTLNLSLTGKAL
ncbi:type IX secretion system protein PorQ [Sediminibacterium sp. C3]|uniref:type IX secretion system protein PorQ n=1 Tax=Sediminibacterium sp. C3 TaxID=1267211 RepID=UPI0003FEA715|nr:type IX secretion system protein PorQ [Sediminibacterium sp. C3]